METVISNDDRIAIAEVDYIIHHMNERYLSKIPQKVQDYITILKKRNLKIYVDPRVPLEKQGLKEFTLYFLMILNLKYWCDDQRRKDILLMLEQNQRKYEDKVNNIFDNANSISGDKTESESSNRPVNRPRQIIVTGSPTFPDKNEELTENKEEAKPATEPEKSSEEIKTTEENKSSEENKEPEKATTTKTTKTTNGLDDLAKETDAMAKVNENSFFVKFVNKIKSFFIKK